MVPCTAPARLALYSRNLGVVPAQIEPTHFPDRTRAVSVITTSRLPESAEPVCWRLTAFSRGTAPASFFTLAVHSDTEPLHRLLCYFFPTRSCPGFPRFPRLIQCDRSLGGGEPLCCRPQSGNGIGGESNQHKDCCDLRGAVVVDSDQPQEAFPG
jgi:hypothetical protein